MINQRPIDDPRLQRVLNEIKEIMAREGFAGACMLVAPKEAAFTYRMAAPWSAFRHDPTLETGFRIRADSAKDGPEIARQRIEGAVHTACQLSDFGEQTTAWMEDIKLMLRRAGIDFEHTPFGGRPLSHLETRRP